MIFRPSKAPGPTLMLPAGVTASVLPPAVDFLPAGRAMLASAVLFDAIRSATRAGDLRE
jgi:hypothetical protein